MARAEIRADISSHGDISIDVDITDENASSAQLIELVIDTTGWVFEKIRNEQMINEKRL